MNLDVRVGELKRRADVIDAELRKRDLVAPDNAHPVIVRIRPVQTYNVGCAGARDRLSGGGT